MDLLTMQSAKPLPKLGRVMLALVVATAMSGVALRPALADGNDKRDEHHEKDRPKARPHDQREQRGYWQPRFYPQPVYVAPPVYYPPQQSPGISLFLPLDIRIR